MELSLMLVLIRTMQYTVLIISSSLFAYHLKGHTRYLLSSSCPETPETWRGVKEGQIRTWQVEVKGLYNISTDGINDFK
jgi:hypothetical protein